MINLITLDPSLTCTAMIINDQKFVYAADHIATKKSGALNKWFALLVDSNLITLRTHNITTKKNAIFSSSELYKLKLYESIVANILVDIQENVIPNCGIHTYIEGYSYSSSVGPLIDLVAYGTLLRKSLYEISDFMTILPPSTLKLESSKLTYPPIIKGKKIEYRNNEGISGGKFNKHEMFKCLIENSSIDCEWNKFLLSYANEILAQKSIPKPIDDINDAKLMHEIYKIK